MADLFGTYGKRIKLTIDHTKIDADLAWFPVTVFLTSSQGEEVFTEFDADEDFDRIAFTSSDGETQLYADCELFDVSESKAIYHVSKTGWTVSSSTDTDIFLYFDNDAGHNTTYISKSGGTAGESVWDSNFKAVYHMQDNTTSTILDSTSNANHGTKKGANEPTEATGKVGQGQDFDGTDDHISMGTSALGVTDKITVETIGKSDTDKNGRLVAKHIGTNGSYGWMLLRANSTDALEWRISKAGTDWNGGLSSDNTYALDTFYYLCGVYDGSNMRVYIDGSEETAGDFPVDLSGNINDSSQDLQIGTDQYSVKNSFDGIIDETRISSTARSAAWIAATYDSLWDTLLTYTSYNHTKKSISGSVSSTGSILKDTTKTLAGILDSSGVMLKSIYKTITGNLDFSGIIEKGKILVQSLFGGLNLSGRITQKAITKTILGTMDFVGSILKFIPKILTGIVGFNGAVSRIRMYYRLILSGILTSSGNLTKKITGKFLRGSLSLTGRLLYWLERIFGSVSWTEESKENENWEEHTH